MEAKIKSRTEKVYWRVCYPFIIGRVIERVEIKKSLRLSAVCNIRWYRENGKIDNFEKRIKHYDLTDSRKYFPTRKKAIEKAIEIHKEKIKEAKREIPLWEREIKKLQLLKDKERVL